MKNKHFSELYFENLLVIQLFIANANKYNEFWLEKLLIATCMITEI